jgi:hypothetical protein
MWEIKIPILQLAIADPDLTFFHFIESNFPCTKSSPMSSSIPQLPKNIGHVVGLIGEVNMA